MKGDRKMNENFINVKKALRLDDANKKERREINRKIDELDRLYIKAYVIKEDSKFDIEEFSKMMNVGMDRTPHKDLIPMYHASKGVSFGISIGNKKSYNGLRIVYRSHANDEDKKLDLTAGELLKHPEEYNFVKTSLEKLIEYGKIKGISIPSKIRLSI